MAEAKAQLPFWTPAAVSGIKIVSYNVLLPNSTDGWWVYKYYSPDCSMTCSSWESRKALLKQQFAAADSDVLCLQELSVDSYEQDWAFLRDLGYDNSVLHTKGGRMRPGTFWRNSVRLCTVMHKDKTLICSFKPSCAEGQSSDPFYVVNCHLKSGHDAARRLRQVHEALDSINKALVSLQTKQHKQIKGKPSAADSPAPFTTRVAVCGDFNCSIDSSLDSSVFDYLRLGAVKVTYVKSCIHTYIHSFIHTYIHT
jgi:mRNA deadenylase 3'-5' endonuclease subunit Ccr4